MGRASLRGLRCLGAPGSAGGSAGEGPGSASAANDSAAEFETTSGALSWTSPTLLAILALIAVILAVAVLTVGRRSRSLGGLGLAPASRVRSGPLGLEVGGVTPVREVEDVVRPRPE